MKVKTIVSSDYTAGSKELIKMEMVSGPLRLKSSRLAGAIRMAQDYGREIVEKLAAA